MQTLLLLAIAGAPVTLDWQITGPTDESLVPYSMPGNVTGTISFADDTGLLAPTSVTITSFPGKYIQPVEVLSWGQYGPHYGTTGGLFELEAGLLMSGSGRWQNLMDEYAGYRPYATFSLNMGHGELRQGYYVNEREYELYGPSVAGEASFVSPEPKAWIGLASLVVLAVVWRVRCYVRYH